MYMNSSVNAVYCIVAFLWFVERYAVTKKKFAEQQLQKVVDKINQSCKGTKRVHFFTMTKLDANNQFDVVIEIVVLKQLEDRKTHWINEGYEAPEMSEECEIRKEETFKIVFKGEIEEDIESERTIEFHKARKINSIVARVFIKCDSKNPKVGIKILKGESVFYDQEVIVNKSILGCCRYQTIRTERKEIFEYEEFQNMDVNCILPPEPEPEPELEPEKEPEPEVEQVESEPEPELEPEPEQKLEPEHDTTLEQEVLPLSDNDSFDSSPVPSEEIERENERLQKVAASENTELTYSVLNPSSIHCLCKCLTLEEAGLFGLQMGLQSTIKQELFKADHPSKELTFKLLRLWGGSKHSRARVKKIQKGLKTINRMDLFDAFSEAFREDLPFPENRRVYID